MDQKQPLIRLALYGNPVKQSLSPKIHALFAEQGGLHVQYDAVQVSEEFLGREVQKLADTGGRGCNITMPLKHRAFQLASHASARARFARASNTLIFETATHWIADNTDGPGIVSDLQHNLGVTLAGLRLALVGAGGAAAGIMYDLAAAAPAEIVLFNRSFDKAEELASRVDANQATVRAQELAKMKKEGRFDLVIHATSAGHRHQDAVMHPALFGPDSICYDLNYGAAHALTFDWCARHRIRCISGLGMLVEQAAASFFLWTGFTPATAPVITLLRARFQPPG